MKPFVILKNGSAPEGVVPFFGDFEDQFLASMGMNRCDALIWDMVRDEAPLPGKDVAGVLITGSLDMLTEERPWMKREAAWVRDTVESGVPVLGVCFGHQMLSWALGGEVGWNPVGPEFGTVMLTLNEAAREDELFRGLPTTLAAQAVHSQSVIRLAPGATVLAGNAHDPHHAVRYGTQAWGLQIHPEFDESLTRMSVELCRDMLEEKGISVSTLLERIRPTPLSMVLMRRFARIVRQRML